MCLLAFVEIYLACDDADCVRGSCVPSGAGDGSACVCWDGYEGEKCDIPSLRRFIRDDDNSCPCQNGATCLYNESFTGEASLEGSICVCPPGFTGDLCAVGE